MLTKAKQIISLNLNFKNFKVDGKSELGRPKTGDAVLVKTQGKLKDGTIVDDNPVSNNKQNRKY